MEAVGRRSGEAEGRGLGEGPAFFHSTAHGPANGTLDHITDVKSELNEVSVEHACMTLSKLLVLGNTTVWLEPGCQADSTMERESTLLLLCAAQATTRPTDTAFVPTCISGSTGSNRVPPARKLQEWAAEQVKRPLAIHRSLPAAGDDRFQPLLRSRLVTYQWMLDTQLP